MQYRRFTAASVADRIIEANELLPTNSVSALSPRNFRNLQPKYKPKTDPSTEPTICYYHKNSALMLVFADPAALSRVYSQWQRHRQ